MNQFNILGRLVKDPEGKKIGKGEKQTTMCKITVAVDGMPDKDGNKKTDYIQCTAWGITAKNIGKYFVKGQQIAITGSIHSEKWEDEDGNAHYGMSFLVHSFDFAAPAPKKEEEEAPKKPAKKAAPKKEEDNLPFDWDE